MVEGDTKYFESKRKFFLKKISIYAFIISVHPPFRRQKNFLPPLAGLIPYCRKKECFYRKSGGMKFFVGELGRTPFFVLPFPLYFFFSCCIPDVFDLFGS